MGTNRHILRAFSAAVLAVASLSCSKDEALQTGKDNTPGEGLYPFSIAGGYGQSEDKNAGTRAYLDPADNTYYWTPGDRVGLTIAPHGSTSPSSLAAFNVAMTGKNTVQALHTTFSGDLTQTQFNALSSGGTFDYYSYYPYNSGLANTFPDLRLSIPSALTLSPDVFNPSYAPMVAVRNNEPPIIYPEGQDLGHDDLVHFDYSHVLSYAAIEMDVNLLQQRQVTSITLTNNNGTQIWGTYVYNMLTGAGPAGGYTSGGSSITINITGGLTVGNKTVLYIPMPPINMSGQTFTITFPGISSTNKYEPITFAGINFVKGTIHRLRVAPVVKYTTGENFTVTKAGYYYIEAFGGNGGTGSGSNGSRTGGSGGTGATVRGLYYLNENDVINVQVGAAGSNGSGVSTYGTGGTTIGTNYGLGNGGNGGTSNTGGGSGNAGAGGGAASGAVRNGTIVLVAGGGGGGGGASGGTTVLLDPSNGGAGGNAGAAGVDGGSGGKSGNSRDGYGGNGNGAGGGNGGGGSAGTANSGVNGGNGGNGGNGSGANTSGSAGGGGGGGYNHGGGGGGGANSGGFLVSSGAGGGGAGGASYLAGTISNPGKTLPSNGRPSTGGYVVITFLR